MAENHAATTTGTETPARAGRKRSFEYPSDEEQEDVEWTKLYKGDCWDDPAMAFRLQYGSTIHRARFAAYENHCCRVLKSIAAWWAGADWKMIN